MVGLDCCGNVSLLGEWLVYGRHMTPSNQWDLSGNLLDVALRKALSSL